MSNEKWILDTVKQVIESRGKDIVVYLDNYRDSLNDSVFLERPGLAYLIEDADLVDRFCREMDVELIGIAVDTGEIPAKGLMYYFNDNLGGYSRTGLENSLK
jgi:hypothetical protein